MLFFYVAIMGKCVLRESGRLMKNLRPGLQPILKSKAMCVLFAIRQSTFEAWEKLPCKVT